MTTLVVPPLDEQPWPTLGPSTAIVWAMATVDYPFPCRDCGVTITSQEERYAGTYRSCVPCGRERKKLVQRRVVARARGEDVPKQNFGPKPTVYPFRCVGVCGGMVEGPEDRYDARLLCKPCGKHYRWIKGIRQRYSLTSEQYVELEAESLGGCQICLEVYAPRGVNLKPLAVDHDHETGEIRGLICHNCNWMLGNAFDDPKRLRAAADYLERSRASQR